MNLNGPKTDNKTEQNGFKNFKNGFRPVKDGFSPVYEDKTIKNSKIKIKKKSSRSGDEDYFPKNRWRL